jgi:citronellol/citronellal dehydrogenase
MKSLQGKTLFITGASRGIGLAIGKRAARDGANIAIAAKSTEEGKLPGTIFTAAAEIEAAGGHALPLPCDIRFDAQVEEAMAATHKRFGDIHILVNNASAIDLRGIDELDMKRVDLMQQINARGTYLCCKLALPYLRQAKNAHILTLSPPLNMDPKWFSPNLAYTMAKYGMSLVTLGLSRDLQGTGIAVNSLWPETTCATAAVAMLGGKPLMSVSRKPEIVADASHIILTDEAVTSGNFFIDADVLRKAGTDLSAYAVTPGSPLRRDLFLPGPEYMPAE